MGHGSHITEDWRVYKEEDDYLTIEFSSQISNWIEEFHESSKKDVNQFLKKMESWLINGNHEIDAVIVLGHSLGEVDYPYFKFLLNELRESEWFISYFDESDKRNKEQHLACIKHKNEKINLFNANNIETKTF